MLFEFSVDSALELFYWSLALELLVYDSSSSYLNFDYEGILVGGATTSEALRAFFACFSKSEAKFQTYNM